MRRNILNNPIVIKSMDFSLAIIDFAEDLDSRKKYVLSRQILASGTSVGALIVEAQTAESKADSVHKLKIAEKEALETQYWLCLCERSRHYGCPKELPEQLEELQKMLYAIIRTSKTKPS